MRVFFSYSHRDALDARRLYRALSVHFPATWLDAEHLGPGDELDPIILGQISQCDAAVICFGPNALGNYQRDVELNALIAAAERGARLVVAVLPGCSPTQLRILEQPPFKGLLFQQFEHTVEEQAALTAIYQKLATGAGSNQPIKTRTTTADTSRVGRIAESIRQNGAVAIVGGTWGHQACDLPNCDPHELDLPFDLDGHMSGHMSPSLRAHLHEIANDSLSLEDAFRKDTRYWNWAPLDVHAALARWAKANMPEQAHYRSDTQRRPLIIATTAIDIRIERALMAARTPFVRFVIDNSGMMIRTQIDSYSRSTAGGSPVEELRSELKRDPVVRRSLAALRESARVDGSALAAIRDHETEFDQMAHVLDDLGFPVPRQDEWWEYCEDERALSYFSSEYSRSAEAPRLNAASHILLIKLNGTIERQASWRVRYMDLLAWPRMPAWLDDMLQGALGNSEVLIFGYRLVDPEFLHVHAGLLEPQRKSGKHRMICPVDLDGSDVTAAFDRRYQIEVDKAAAKLGLEAYRQESAAEMLTRLASIAVARTAGVSGITPSSAPSPAPAATPMATPATPGAAPAPPPPLSGGDVWVA